ncbi:MAG TPA: hypothetical protein VJM32_04530 [Candidatus Saccharimonadales bacterium]|nr:hypothetical protein [Candidatus Saccharimonadales bacterium]
MSQRRSPVLVVVVVVVVALLCVGGIGYAIYDHFRGRNAAEAQFERDLRDAGFNADAEWKDETTCTKKNKNGTCKTSKTESELDAVATVGGCRLELERTEDAAYDRAPVVNGKPGVRAYKFDEVNDGSDDDGVDVEDGEGNRAKFTTPNPSREQVYDYLAANNFTRCFAANAAKN